MSRRRSDSSQRTRYVSRYRAQVLHGRDYAPGRKFNQPSSDPKTGLAAASRLARQRLTAVNESASVQDRPEESGAGSGDKTPGSPVATL